LPKRPRRRPRPERERRRAYHPRRVPNRTEETMPFAGVNGQRLYYEVGGDGDTIVLIHGALASADIMEAPATGLASGFRALRYDRRGHGRSNPVAAPLSLAEEVADLASLLDWFSAPTTHILAHDEGAEVALEFVLSYPSRV